MATIDANADLTERQPMKRQTVTEWQHDIKWWAMRKGWLDNAKPREPLHLLMLVVTELAEAAEAFRHGNPPCERPGMERFSHAEEELADAVIRLLQMAGEFGWDIEAAIAAKMAFNETRPHRHGKLA